MYQVQAWRANPSTSTQAKELWSALGAANTAIAETLNMIATRASDDGAGAENFEASSKVGFVWKVSTSYAGHKVSMSAARREP